MSDDELTVILHPHDGETIEKSTVESVALDLDIEKHWGSVTRIGQWVELIVTGMEHDNWPQALDAIEIRCGDSHIEFQYLELTDIDIDFDGFVPQSTTVVYYGQS